MDIRDYIKRLRRAATALDDLLTVGESERERRDDAAVEIGKRIVNRLTGKKKGKKRHVSNGRNRPDGFTDREREVIRALRSRGPMAGNEVINAIGIKGKATHIYRILGRLKERKKIRQLKDRRYQLSETDY